MLIAAVALAGCTGGSLDDVAPKAEKRIPDTLLKEMEAKGMNRTSSIMGRIFKEEGKLEIWKMRNNGRYALIKSYNICKWSGQLGPKFIEGDRQAPEGFYTVRPGQMNPNSSYHLSFNIGYPNAFDRAHGRTGANLMVHGECSSSGCYSMENNQVEEIYALAREAFRGGQTEFQIQAFPFRMTAANMARYKDDPNYSFWQNLKEGYDQFEITRLPPKVDVCEKRYVFNQLSADGAAFNAAGACPAASQPSELLSAYQSFKAKEDAAFEAAAGSASALPRSQTIAGIEEARLVQEWTRKRGRGERVSVEPPAMRSDGTVVATATMGRIDSPAGRKMAAIEAAAAAKKAAEEEKKRAAEAKKLAEAMAKAEKEAAKKAAELAAETPAEGEAKAQAGATAEATGTGAVEPAAAAAPEKKRGLLGSVTKRIGNIFGS